MPKPKEEGVFALVPTCLAVQTHPPTYPPYPKLASLPPEKFFSTQYFIVLNVCRLVNTIQHGGRDRKQTWRRPCRNTASIAKPLLSRLTTPLWRKSRPGILVLTILTPNRNSSSPAERANVSTEAFSCSHSQQASFVLTSLHLNNPTTYSTDTHLPAFVPT